jgi:hypothetical protein
MGPARNYTESLAPDPELENSQGHEWLWPRRPRRVCFDFDCGLNHSTQKSPAFQRKVRTYRTTSCPRKRLTHIPDHAKCEVIMNPKPSPFTTEWIVVLAISLASCLLSFGPASARALALVFMACAVALLSVLIAHEISSNQPVNPKEIAKPVATVRRGPPIEWSIVHDVRPAPGTAVVTYAKNELPKLVIDGYGRLFEYVGVAPRRIDGEFDVDALKPREFIVRPGHVYRYRKERKGRWAAVTIRASKLGTAEPLDLIGSLELARHRLIEATEGDDA